MHAKPVELTVTKKRIGVRTSLYWASGAEELHKLRRVLRRTGRQLGLGRAAPERLMCIWECDNDNKGAVDYDLQRTAGQLVQKLGVGDRTQASFDMTPSAFGFGPHIDCQCLVCRCPSVKDQCSGVSAGLVE